jgi:7-keto-8-aminopelargonate synthetase-like enzyme
LEKKLKSYAGNRKLIVTDGVFSMDGDIAPIPEIVELAEKYGAMTMIDDAHATGVLGKHGGGTLDYFELDPSRVDILMGTFTKALGAIGGFVAGKKELIEYLRIAVRTYMYTAPILPGNVAAILAAINDVQTNPERRNKLWGNANYLKNALKSKGFNIFDSETAIVPVFIGDEKKAIEVSRILFEKGIFAPCVRWPVVPKNKSRIRITVMSSHTREQIDYLINSLVETLYG